MNLITDLINLEDSNVFMSDTSTIGDQKFITLETHPSPHYCPSCGFRMHSKGIKIRRISHPILQDGFKLTLILKQRRWKCTNPDCDYESNETFNFVNPNRRCTNATDMMIVLAFRDLSETAVSIARKYNTSDTHVLDVFDRYVRLDRLTLPDIISVDEVFLDMSDEGRYALVIQDFRTGDTIDVLRSRRAKITEPYFASIPIEERNNVKYLLSDMYNQYISFVDKYFPHAVPVVDAFHVIQWMIHAIDMYIRQLEKKFRQRDRERAEKLSMEQQHPVPVQQSDEVYLLKKYRWLVLSNQSNINYHMELRMDSHFHRMMNSYDYEYELFRIDSRLERLRDLKELYVQFNARNAGNPIKADEELSPLIERFLASGDSIFVDFAQLLIKYHDPIINSFIMVQKEGSGGLYDSRLSNGPIESLNRKIKDMKRLGRGFRNFEHFRNRFLYATRNNPVLNGHDNRQVQYLADDDDE